MSIDENHDSALTPAAAFRLAVERLHTQAAMARIAGKTQGAVSKRIAAGLACWPENVLAIEEATGISRHDLRPDIYPREAFAPRGGEAVEGIRP